jgi:hypothetical protein
MVFIFGQSHFEWANIQNDLFFATTKHCKIKIIFQKLQE